MIHFLLGTRAQLIKMAPLMYECSVRQIPYNFIFLAQHKNTIYEMIDAFEIKKPDHIINDIGIDITKSKQMFIWSLKSLIQLTNKKNKIFLNDKKGIVLLHGDAPPVLLGGLGAKYMKLKIALVESGLRSFDFFNPFPEELTRFITWKLGLIDYHFCFDDISERNLKKFKGKVFNVGMNTMYDAQQLALKKRNKFETKIPSKKYAIVTIHRYENIYKKERIERIVNILEYTCKQIHLFFILHPPTKVALKNFNLYNRLDKNKSIELSPRYPFFEFNNILYQSEFIFTDGGSNQEEAYYMGKPCLLLRYKTERKEGLNYNVVLSEFKDDIIYDFVKNYNKFKSYEYKIQNSPSRSIINHIINLGYTR